MLPILEEEVMRVIFAYGSQGKDQSEKDQFYNEMVREQDL